MLRLIQSRSILTPSFGNKIQIQDIPNTPHSHIQYRYRYYQQVKSIQRLWRRLIPTGSIPECPIEWKQPPKLPFYHPWRTGDCQRIHDPIDMTQAPDIVNSSSEFIDANDSVKKSFSFEFLGRKYAMLKIKSDMMKSVQSHIYDTTSIEVRIAAFTAQIRNFNEHFEQYTAARGNPPRGKVVSYFNEAILCRYGKLNELRKTDYKKFEWLLEKLNITFAPRHEHDKSLTRKHSIHLLTDKYIEDYKEEKLNIYRQTLHAQKEDFLKHKLNTLQWIMKEEMECGVDPSVTEEDIAAARKQLNDHQEELRRVVIVEDKSANILVND